MREESAVVFDIEKFAVHDGPGIRSVVFIKRCPLRCLWCHNPESQTMEPELLYNAGKCTSCGQCAAVCPKSCHVIRPDGVHEFDRAKCVRCGRCAEDCPSGALAVVHPDLLTAGGILETKKIGDMAEEYGVQMNIHMAESPIACLAAVHVAAATRNFMALELHSVDVPWWGDLVNPTLKYDGGFIDVPDTPGLGIESLNEELIREKLHPDFPEAWAPTDEWDKEWSNDRQWS